MKSLSVALFVLVVAAIVAGGVFLMTWEIPAPTRTVEKVIPNDRFDR
jgi:Flp pilus assembly protein CpaB